MVLLGIAALVVCSVFVSAAVGEPGMSFQGAEVSETTVVVGENVTVTSTVLNAGSSGGGYTFTFERDRVDFAETRVSVPAQESRTVSTNVSFDSPGTYRITVNDRPAGVVTVESARASVVSTNDTQRRIAVRANGVSETEPVTVTAPPTNATFGIERWSVRTGESAFEQYLTEYRSRADVPVELPAEGESTLLGVVTVRSDVTVDQSTVRLSLQRSALANSSLDSDEVATYERNGTTWVRQETSIVAERPNRTVYEATVTTASTYVVGSIDADIDVASQTLTSTSTREGRRFTIDADLRNTGPVDGQYDGTLLVNGERVNETVVSVPAAGESSLSLSYEVTEPGNYTLSVDESNPVRVVVKPAQLGTQQDESAAEGAPDTETSTGKAGTAVGENSGSSPVQGVLPATVFGIDTLYLVSGIGIGVLLFSGILLVLRRSEGGRSDSFDQY